MYVKYEGEPGNYHPVAYAYGEPWVAEALFMDDLGYPSEEEAKIAWLSGHVDGVKRNKDV